ncbi:MAG TPA: alpha/beta hydrolase, partial [Myxococcota bacterium]
AYEKIGTGPPLVLVDGALCGRTFGPSAALAPLLADAYTVAYYDRRGRGDSDDKGSYSVDREIDDLVAVVDALGGHACLYGTSSGAALALRAVGSGRVVADKLVLHEPPFALDGTHTPSPPDFREQIAAFIKSDKRSEAASLFLRVVGVPAPGVFFMKHLIPGVWPKMKAAAHTLPYDFAILGDTQSGGALPQDFASAASSIKVPTLVVVGGKSPPWMHHAVTEVASRIAGARERELPGQQHNVAAKAIAPALREFFAG